MLAWVYQPPKLVHSLMKSLLRRTRPRCRRCAISGLALPAYFARPSSGTDRLYAVSRVIDADIYVNIQGDEPLLLPRSHHGHLGAVYFSRCRRDDPKVRCTSEDIANPNAVKVVTALTRRALYFSRSHHSFDRDGQGNNLLEAPRTLCISSKALERFAALAPSELELSSD